MKKKLLVLLCAGVLVVMALLGGCGTGGEEKGGASGSGGAGDGSGKTIRWLTQGPGEGSWEGKTKELLEQFEKDTGIKVEAEFYSFGDLFDVIETKASTGSTDFDVMSVDVTFVSKYAENGYIASLDSYFTEEEKAQFDAASYVAGVWEDTMYAAPQNTSSQLLFYNKSLIEEAGIEIPENDAQHRLTYEQVAELAKEGLEILDPDGSRGLIGFDFQQVSRVYQMNMLANSRGGRNIGDDGLSVDGVINTDAWMEAMEWYQNLVNDGIASRGYTTEEVGAQFESGKMLFMIGGTWTPEGMVTDDEVGYTYAPCFEGYETDAATATGSWYFGLNAQTEEEEAAAEFIKYMTLGTGSDMWLQVNNDVPSRIDKQEEVAADENASGILKIAAYEAANTAVPRAVTPAFGEYSSILNQTWEDVRNGADIEEALESAVRQIEAATAAYRQ